MPNTTYKTIIAGSTARYTDRGSRFYAHAFQVSNIALINKKLVEIKKKYPDATHHCYAWRLNPSQPQEFTHDDGEPGGTAGLPILRVITSKNLINILIIVARYFGGRKLGKPGLIHAYRESAETALASVRHTVLRKYVPFSVAYPYDQESRIRELANRFQLLVKDEKFQEYVTLTLYCNENKSDELRNILTLMEHTGIRFTTLPVCYLTDDSQYNNSH